MGLKKQMKGVIKKKAIFFTVSAIFILGFIFSLIVLQDSLSNTASYSVSSNRLVSVNAFIDNVGHDGEFALYTAGFRAVISTIQHIENQLDYVDSAQDTLQELMFEGTIDGESVFLMENNTFSDWLDKVSMQAQQRNILFEHTVPEIAIEQTQPWVIDISVSFIANFTDTITQATWNRSFSATAQVPIVGFLDPVYIVGTTNQIFSVINQTPHDGMFVVGGDSSNLQDHVTQQYYVSFAGAPNFLMRLEGDLTPSMDQTGIESLVDKAYLSLYMPIDSGRTNVDFLYFSTGALPVYEFSNMPSIFRLDNQSSLGVSRLELYQLDAFVYE
ncbi:MAG: hypothetical protein ACMXYF_00800 [Candidatus Woesearchaeota archaeon]